MHILQLCITHSFFVRVTGMVAICAGCNVVDPWAAAVIGVIAAVAYHFWSCMMLKMKIDDPLDAVAGENLELNFIVFSNIIILG